MKGFLLFSGVAAFAGAAIAGQSVVSDIQLILVSVLLVGGVLCFGLTAVLASIDEVQQMQKMMPSADGGGVAGQTHIGTFEKKHPDPLSG